MRRRLNVENRESLGLIRQSHLQLCPMRNDLHRGHLRDILREKTFSPSSPRNGRCFLFRLSETQVCFKSLLHLVWLTPDRNRRRHSRIRSTSLSVFSSFVRS